MDHGDTFVEDIMDIVAGLGVTPLVKVAYWVVVRVGDIVFYLLTLDNAAGVLLITVIFQGIFYCCHTAK